MNGKLLENVSHFDAVDALKAAGDTMHMVIKRDPDFSEAVSNFLLLINLNLNLVNNHVLLQTYKIF